MPVCISGFFGIEMVGHHIGIPFQVEGYPIAQPEINAQTAPACHEKAGIFPQILQGVACLVQLAGFVVMESIISGNAQKEVGIEKTAVVEATQTIGDVEDGIYIQLDKIVFVLVGRCCLTSFGLPAAESTPQTPYRTEAVDCR